MAIEQIADLGRRGGVYLAARYALSLLLSLGNMLVMTWWIGPHAYGTFVTAVSFTTLFASIARFGVDTYLVRCERAPEQRGYNVAFTLVALLALFMVALGICLVPVLRLWFGRDDFAWPYLILLVSVPLTALTGVSTACLERSMNFRKLAAIELIGQVLAFISALCLAARGFGVWAPVCGMFLWQVFAMMATCRAARLHPRPALDQTCSREMLRFGFGVSLSLRAWQLRSLINPVIVGRFAGLESVAYVAFALRMADGLGFLRVVASRLGIATLARLQENRQAFREALEKALFVQVATLGPLLAAFVLSGPSLVGRFFGRRWAEAMVIFPFVAVGVLINSVFNLEAAALFVVGREWAVMRAYGLHVSILAIATWALLPRLGIVGYGWAELLACVGYVFIFATLRQVTTVSYRRILPATGICLTPSLLSIARLYS